MGVDQTYLANGTYGVAKFTLATEGSMRSRALVQ